MLTLIGFIFMALNLTLFIAIITLITPLTLKLFELGMTTNSTNALMLMPESSSLLELSLLLLLLLCLCLLPPLNPHNRSRLRTLPVVCATVDDLPLVLLSS